MTEEVRTEREKIGTEFVQTVRETVEPDFLRSADILRTELVCKYVLTGTATH